MKHTHAAQHNNNQKQQIEGCIFPIFSYQNTTPSASIIPQQASKQVTARKQASKPGQARTGENKLALGEGVLVPSSRVLSLSLAGRERCGRNRKEPGTLVFFGAIVVVGFGVWWLIDCTTCPESQGEEGRCPRRSRLRAKGYHGSYSRAAGDMRSELRGGSG